MKDDDYESGGDNADSVREMYRDEQDEPVTTEEKLAKVIERQSFVLMEMMQAYERRVRSDCKTQEEIDKRPWECAEYRAAADLLKTLHSPPPSEDSR